MELRVKDYTLEVNVPDWDSLRALVSQRFSSEQGFAMATVNLDHLVKLRSSFAFRRAYEAQDFVVADGNPIVWMSRLARQPVSLIPGSEAILPLARIAAEHGVSVALLGSTDKALMGAKAYLEQNVAGLSVVSTISPPMGFDPSGPEAESMLRDVELSGARLCFLALGAPKQEELAAVGRRVAPSVGFASIGAGLDFFAGTQKRAPDWAQKYAVEWLWRALSSPKRLGPRYLKCIAILPGHMLGALQRRFSGPSQQA